MPGRVPRSSSSLVSRSGIFGVSAFLALVAASSPEARAQSTSAESKARCQVAYEHGQQLRRDGRLAAARVELLVCRETCPASLTPDCDRWLDEVNTLLPTAIVRAKDEKGARVRDVRVSVDGRLLGDPPPEQAVVLEPGERVFRFERPSADPVEVRVALQPGERDHLVEVTVASRAVRTEPSRVPSYVLGATGISALAIAGGLAIKGHVDRADLESACSPACSPDDVSGIRTLWWASGITAGVGAISVGLAALLWPRSAQGSTTLVVGAGTVGLGGTFR